MNGASSHRRGSRLKKMAASLFVVALVSTITTVSTEAAPTAPASTASEASHNEPSPALRPAGWQRTELLIDAPATAEVGDRIFIDIAVAVSEPIVAYHLDAEVIRGTASIDPFRQSVLGQSDLVTDRSIGSLGRRAVLAATSCPDSGCASGESPVGADGVVDLGGFVVTVDRPEIIEIDLPSPELVGLSGSLLSSSPAGRRIRIKVGIPPKSRQRSSGPGSIPEPEWTTTSESPSAIPAPTSPEDIAFEWHSDVLEGCSTGCLSVADVQAAAATPTPVATAMSGTGNTFTVDTISDSAAWDANPGDGICATSSGTCTLRAAMQEDRNDQGPNTINFAIPGAGPHTIQLTSRLPALTDATGGTTIDGYSQPGAIPNTDSVVSNANILIEVRGGGPFAFDAFIVRSPNNTISGLAVYDARRPIWVYGPGADDNTIIGNYIGTDAAGTFETGALAPTAHGVHIEQQAKRTIVGTPALADRNVISGNARHGLGTWSNNTDGTVVQNNIVGLNPSGTLAIPNAKHGLDVNFGSSDTLLGGSGVGEGNLISGNLDSGVEVSHTLETERTTVSGNRIGTTPDGESATPETANANTGVYVEDGVVDTVIEGNIIGNNLKGGIRIINGGSNGTTTGTVIRNNWIGISANGLPLPNGQVGVSVDGSQSVIGPGNEIANNPTGIDVNEFDAIGNTITQNSIHDNGDIGIDLAPPGTNTNDPSDLDTGPNGLLNHPEFDRATSQIFEGTACAGCAIEVFSTDPGGLFLAGFDFIVSGVADAAGEFAIVNPDANFGYDITATATDPTGNTSEFALPTAVVEHSDPPTAEAGDPVTTNEGDTVLLTGSGVDPDGGALTYNWDLDGDLIYETPGQTVTFDAANVDGLTVVTVGLQVTDITQLTATDTIDITVENAPPTGDPAAPNPVDEGSDFIVTIDNASDPSPDDLAAGLRYAIFCQDETPTIPDYATASTVAARTCNASDGPGSADVVTQIVDDDGGYTEQSTTVAVTNVEPEVAIFGMPATIAEGSQLNLTAETSDPSIPDQAAGLSVAWAVAIDGIVVANETGPSLLVDVTDDGVWDVTASTTDKDGGIGTAATTVNPFNVAPTATLETVVTVDGEVSIDISLNNPVDPGSLDTTTGFHYAFDCDGAPLDTIDYATASPIASATCTFNTGASLYPLSAAIIDKDEGVSPFATTASTGPNAPPSVSAAPFVGTEGSSIELTATATDPEGGPLTYDWDLDGDAAFETPGQTVSFDGSTIDGPSVINVDVRATDAEGLTSIASTSITVNNAIPTATFEPVIAAEGQVVSVSVADASDPSPADAAALRYTFDCQGGSLSGTDYASASVSPTIDCSYSDGPLTGSIAARVLDDDGGIVDLSTTVTVTNVDPTITISPPAPAVEGDSITIMLLPDDISPGDKASLSTSWVIQKSGSTITSGVGTAAVFVAPDDDIFTVTATVNDKDGGSATEALEITVSGVAPTAALVSPAEADERSTVTLELTDSFDPGPADTTAGLRYGFTCDGNAITTTYATASQSPVTECVVGGPGTATVLARVIDANDLFTEYSGSIAIANLAPTARFDVAREVNLFETIAVGASDPSDLDLDYSFDCGAGYGPYSPVSTAICDSDNSPGFRTVGLRIRDAQLSEQTYTAVVAVHRDYTGNGSFEAGAPTSADGWTIPSAGSIITTNARTGLRAIEVSSQISTESVIRTDFFPIDQLTIELGGWVDIIDTGDSVSVQLKVVWATDTGATISTTAGPILDSLTGGYIDLTRTATPPPSATKAKLQIFVTTEGDALVRIDDIGMHPANAIENPDLHLDDDLNGRPDQWWSLSRFISTSTPVHDTSGSAQLTNDGTGFTPGQKIDTVAVGETYLASIWIHIADDAANVPIRLRARWKDPSNSTVRLDVLDIVRFATPGWVQLSGSAIAPTGATDVNFELRVANGLISSVFVDSAFMGPA